MMQRDPVAAAGLLYRRYSGYVARLIRRLLGGDSDQGDIVQQVFLTVMRRGHSLRDPSRIRAWIHSVTERMVYAELRRRAHRQLFLRDSALLRPDLAHRARMRELFERTHALIERLPEEERKVFILHHVEGRSVAEIAALCGYSLATARRRQKAAKRRFEALLAGDAELPQPTTRGWRGPNPSQPEALKVA